MQLLPNGKQQFFNNAGVPLAGGKVYFYQPGTTTPLITWQDQAGTTANANPVTLDGAGEAVIWGNTTYRQVVQDSTGTQIWDELVDAAVSHDELASPSGSALIGFVQAGPGAVPRTVQDKVRESIGIMDFGAVGDGVTDDGPAIQAAIVYAASFASGVKIRPIVLIPAGTYRIATTIIAASYVKIVGYGAELIGPIAGYPPIGNTTAVAAAGDIQAQTGGACFADTILTDPSAGAATVVSAAFEGFTLNNFRYGFCSRGFSWYYPELRNITWVNINIGCFAYNGAQMWKLENPAANNCNVVFVGAATAYTSGHPLSSNIFTGSFCDGLQVVGYSSNPMLTNANPDLDNWFSQSVLRPNSISTVEGFSGVYPLATASPANLATTFQNVSGRAIYIGQRHNRLTFNTSIRNIHSLGAARGVVCIANPTNLQLSHFGGEGMFTNSTINAGPTECVVVLGNTNGATISASVSNVEGAYVTGTVYDSVVGVAGSAAIYSDIELHNITGKTNPIYYQFFISANLAVDTYGAYSVNNFRTDINLNAIIPQTASQYVTVLGGSWQREFDNSTGLSLIKKQIAGTIPQTGGTETIAYMILGSPPAYRGKYEAIQGRVRIYLRRLDTGIQDYGDFLVTWGVANSSVTLSAAASSGDLGITVSSGLLYGPGSIILINSSDRYVVKTKSGNVLTLCSPLRNSYVVGAAVTQPLSIDTTLRAFSGGIASFAVAPTGFTLTNSLGNTVPVDFRAAIESFGSPSQH